MSANLEHEVSLVTVWSVLAICSHEKSTLLASVGSTDNHAIA
ncbi:hypothetical protein ACGFY8_02170 [Streptomyces sp. NPDC048232]